jgi:hypothetical protein
MLGVGNARMHDPTHTRCSGGVRGWDGERKDDRGKRSNVGLMHRGNRTDMRDWRQP